MLSRIHQTSSRNTLSACNCNSEIHPVSGHSLISTVGLSTYTSNLLQTVMILSEYEEDANEVVRIGDIVTLTMWVKYLQYLRADAVTHTGPNKSSGHLHRTTLLMFTLLIDSQSTHITVLTITVVRVLIQCTASRVTFSVVVTTVVDRGEVYTR